MSSSKMSEVVLWWGLRRSDEVAQRVKKLFQSVDVLLVVFLLKILRTPNPVSR